MFIYEQPEKPQLGQTKQPSAMFIVLPHSGHLRSSFSSLFS